MEQHTLKSVKNPWNTNIYYYLETFGGQISNLYVNVVYFLILVIIRYLWQLKTVVFLHWCLVQADLLFFMGEGIITSLLSATFCHNR